MKVKGYSTFDKLKTCLVGRTYNKEQFNDIKNQKVKDVLFKILDETEEEGTEFSLEERHMLRNLLGFRDVRVDDVMVPRADISAIDLATFGEDVLAVFVESGHSRLPVYRETLDSPVGMLHLKDVIFYLQKHIKFDIKIFKA